MKLIKYVLFYLKRKNNVLIIGEAGVGKSALVEKLAMMINQGK